MQRGKREERLMAVRKRSKRLLKRSPKKRSVCIYLQPRCSFYISFNLPTLLLAYVDIVDFDPSAPKTFKCSANAVNGDEGYVYNVLKDDSPLTNAEFVSVELFDIVTSFNIPLKAYQEIVDMISTESLSVESVKTVTTCYVIPSKAHQQILNLLPLTHAFNI